MSIGDDPLRALALRCAHELFGYAVDVRRGGELLVVQARLDQLDRCCASYSRSLARMHAKEVARG